MEANAVLDLLEQNRFPNTSDLIPGLSQAFFERVYALFSADIDRCILLAKRWKKVLKAGDEPGFTYRAKGLGEWLQGRWRQAAESFLEAGRLQTDGSWTFALPAVDALGRAGDVAQALLEGEKLMAKLSGDPLSQARLRVNLGNVYEQTDQLTEAYDCFTEALQILSGSEDHELDFAKALAGQSACAWQMSKVDECRSAGERAMEIFSRLGQQVNRDVCAGNLAQLSFLEGRLDETIQALTDIRSRSGGPRSPWIAELLGYAYRRLNLIPEAVDCLEEALARGGCSRVGSANLQGALALSVLDLGQDSAAKAHFRSAKRLYRKIGNRVMPALMDVGMAQHQIASKQLRAAEKLATSAASILSGQGEVRGALFARAVAAEAAVLQGKSPVGASELVQELVDSHDPNLVWRGRYLDAALIGTDLGLYREMVEALLQSRLLLSSPLSRAAFWGDKKRALDRFLSFLLGTGRREDIEEAFDVVSRIRSATLIDEILSSSSGFDERQRSALAELRGQLNILSEAEGVPPHLRFSTRAARVGRAISRQWHEVTREVLGPSPERNCSQSDARCVALVSIDDTYRVLTPQGDSIPLGQTISDIERQAATFRFECMEPLIDPAASATYCMGALQELYRSCYLPWKKHHLSEICPDEGLWSIPWQAFPFLAEEEGELALRLTPMIAGRPFEKSEPGTGVAIWIGANGHLPNIGRERDLLLERFPGAIICESRAEVLAKMQNQSVELVHVSAHGRHQDGNPMFSYIDFEDGPLYAAEITGMNFRTQRAVLLSCESGRVSIPFRREPDGLSRAFLARGAEEVVGSSWLLDDDAAYMLFDALYENSTRGPFSQGLSKGRRKLFDKYGHPFYWASPVLIKGYGVPDHA